MRQLDVDDPVAIKCVEILAKDVFTRVRLRKRAINTITYPRVPVRVAPSNIPIADERPSPPLSRPHALEMSEYDAIIADAQRRVTSPLPMPSYLQQDQHRWSSSVLADPPPAASTSRFADEELDGVDPSDVYTRNPWLSDSSASGSDTEEEETARVQDAARTLSGVQAARDSPNNRTRPSSNHDVAGSSAALRERIISRLEHRRRDRLARAEVAPSSNPHFNVNIFDFDDEEVVEQGSTDVVPLRTRGSGPSSNVSHSSAIPNPLTASLPIVIGSEYASSPRTISQSGNHRTLRMSYPRIPQRSNSIRRSGYHDTTAASVSRRTNDVRADSPESLPLSISRPSPPPLPSPPRADPSADSARATLRAIAARDSSSASHNPGSSRLSDYNDITHTLSTRASAFEDFARITRQAARNHQEGQDNHRPDESGSLSLSSSMRRTRRPDQAEEDPTLVPPFAVQSDSTAELLGSSSSVAALDYARNYRPSSPVGETSRPFVARANSPPNAPLLQHRSYPFDITTPPASTTFGEDVRAYDADLPS